MRVPINQMAEICETIPSSVRIAACESGHIVSDTHIEDWLPDSGQSKVFFARLAQQPCNSAQKILRDLKPQKRQNWRTRRL